MTYLEPFFAAPVLPSTVLMMFMVLWAVMGLIGVIGHDIDAQPDLPEATGSLGGLTLQWLNLRDIPLMLWLGSFAIGWWLISLGLWFSFDAPGTDASSWTITQQIARNTLLAVGIAKLLTQPMSGWFRPGQDYNSESLIGQVCEIWTATATASSGQARLKTDAAPLLLNIHTDGPNLTRGTLVEIVSYDPQRRIYTVTRAPVEANV